MGVIARVVMAGGGACGLLTAMLLAKDGHEVVVLERDLAPPPPPAEAWDAWERRGVNQFRLPHGLLPRFLPEVSAELPAVTDRLRSEGAHESNMLGPDGPPQYQGVTARRPFVEACVAHEAAEVPGVDIRRGVSVAGLVAGAEVTRGTPHVVGVRLDSGEELAADLVIDSGGRRSALPRWLGEIGARPGIEQKEDAGFVYYGTHYRATDGVPRAEGPPTRNFGSISVLALPGELGTWGLGLITTAGDAELRGLRREDTWLKVMRALPDNEHLLDGERMHEIRVMSSIEDRFRRYVRDGAPVATGVVALADAVAATNPSKGRGITMGFLHGLGLRDTMRKVGLDDPAGFAAAFDDMTEEVITPQYWSTVWDDRHRMAQVDAHRRGVAPDYSDPEWRRWNQFLVLAMAGPPLLLRFFDFVLLRATPQEILADPEVQAAMEAAGEIDIPHPAGPSRAELLEIVASA